MDDVLASIRRIIRAEKENPGAAGADGSVDTPASEAQVDPAGDVGAGRLDTGAPRTDPASGEPSSTVRADGGINVDGGEAPDNLADTLADALRRRSSAAEQPESGSTDDGGTDETVSDPAAEPAATGSTGEPPQTADTMAAMLAQTIAAGAAAAQTEASTETPAEAPVDTATDDEDDEVPFALTTDMMVASGTPQPGGTADTPAEALTQPPDPETSIQELAQSRLAGIRETLADIQGGSDVSDDAANMPPEDHTVAVDDFADGAAEPVLDLSALGLSDADLQHDTADGSVEDAATAFDGILDDDPTPDDHAADSYTPDAAAAAAAEMPVAPDAPVEDPIDGVEDAEIADDDDDLAAFDDDPFEDIPFDNLPSDEEVEAFAQSSAHAAVPGGAQSADMADDVAAFADPAAYAGPAIVPAVSLAAEEAVEIGQEPPAQPPVMLDESAIEAMVKRVLTEALMGEIGQNISANVTRLVEDEVARQLAAKSETPSDD